MNFFKLNINIELEVKTQGNNSKLKEKTQNSREKLNLRGAVALPVAPSGVTKKAGSRVIIYEGKK